MLHDSANDGGFVALKRAAEDREGWIHSWGQRGMNTQLRTERDEYTAEDREGW